VYSTEKTSAAAASDHAEALFEKKLVKMEVRI
jgi:hypothetical protein